MDKHPGGRPPVWKSPEELQSKVNAYFADCESRERKPCIAGLAYWCDVDRHTIYNYEEKTEYFHIIKKARDYILAGLEETMIHGEGGGGAIFLAKNYGYTDQRNIVHDVQGSLNKLLQNHFFNDAGEK